MAYTVHLDQDLCISSGKCVADAPAVFGFDDDDIAEVLADPAPIPDPRLLEIARNCPSGAITLRDGAREVPTW